MDCNYFFYFQAGKKPLSFTPIYFMEQYPETSLFELQVDQPVQTYLGETARWAKFLGIMGFICSGLFTLIALFAIAFSTSKLNSIDRGSTQSSAIIGLVTLVVGSLIMFFPCLYLYNFATRMQLALRGNDQEHLIRSFRSLKAFFRFIGILAILYMGLIIVIILFNIYGTVSR